MQVTMDDVRRIPTANCNKIFIGRDYSEGTHIRFLNKFPQELDGKIERPLFEQAITTINNIYHDAESLNSRVYCESCLSCLTAYLSYLCMDTYYEKCIKKCSRYVEEQNTSVWVPRGLMLIDPVERGLRCIEIVILGEPAAASSSSRR